MEHDGGDAKRSDMAFWRGEIASLAHAEKTTSRVGWIFAAIGILVIVTPLLAPHPAYVTSTEVKRGLAGALAVAGLFGIPGAFLIKRRSRGAAIVLFSVCSFGMIMMTLMAIAARDPTALLGTALWGLGAAATWRAQAAAGAWKRLGGSLSI